MSPDEPIRAPGWALANLRARETDDECLSQARAALDARAHLKRATTRWIENPTQVARLVVGAEAERTRTATLEAELALERLRMAQASAEAELPSWLGEAENALAWPAAPAPATMAMHELQAAERRLAEREAELAEREEVRSRNTHYHWTDASTTRHTTFHITPKLP
jgi:hypothetical protein